MNKKAFYTVVRAELFNGSISTLQLQGIEAIIYEHDRYPLNDLRKLAYILATAFHETAKTMQPIREYGKGQNYAYGKKLKMSRQPYATPDHLFYGRGFVQLTWYENYALMGKYLNIDLLNNPDLALKMDISIQIMYQGMIRGSFTGRKLADYFTDESTDFVNARKIINGLDQAPRIAGYATIFYKALTTL